jgi:hypothetical protein
VAIHRIAVHVLRMLVMVLFQVKAFVLYSRPHWKTFHPVFLTSLKRQKTYAVLVAPAWHGHLVHGHVQQTDNRRSVDMGKSAPAGGPQQPGFDRCQQGADRVHVMAKLVHARPSPDPMGRLNTCTVPRLLCVGSRLDTVGMWKNNARGHPEDPDLHKKK